MTAGNCIKKTRTKSSRSRTDAFETRLKRLVVNPITSIIHKLWRWFSVLYHCHKHYTEPRRTETSYIQKNEGKL